MQFTLRDILLTFVVVAASLGLCGAGGIPVSAVLIAAIIYGRTTGHVREMGCLLVLAFACSVLGLLPAVNAAREPKRRQLCARNMEEIGLALQAYRNEHGRFPPLCITDSNGEPMHSWRVLIMPYLGYKDLYDQYDFGEPWDGANNIKLADKCPDALVCRSVFHPSDSRTTTYVAVTGSGSGWAESGAAPENIPNATSNSILVVETADSRIDWLQPNDLSLAEAAAGIFSPCDEQKPRPCIVHAHFGVHALFADGSVRFLPEDIPQNTLKSLLTSDGDKQIDINTLGLPRLNVGQPWLYKRMESPWRAPVALAVLVASVILLFRPRSGPGATIPQEESQK